MEAVTNFLKNHGFDFDGLVAALIGALIVCGYMPTMTFRQSLTVIGSGIAVDAYLVPLALHYLSLPTDGHLASALGFLAGLIGMRVIIVFIHWAERVKNPSDFLKAFTKDADKDEKK